ncbi:adenosine receptor A2b-like [Diadema setosum]|uniref:adenosine receptor A2b-like n=1 Tax=Diadema setosum TaxID=31175 RepID=UPI003B3B5BF8
MSTFYTVCEISIAVMSVLGNGLVLYVYASNQRLHSVTNYFIVSLAIADLFVGLFGVPFAILTSEGLPRDFIGCVIMLNFLLWLCGASTFSLIGVSLDRYVAISYPLRYNVFITPLRALVAIVVCWIMAAIVGFLPVVGWHRGRPETPACVFIEIIDMNYMLFNAIMVIYIPLVVMIVIYVFIFRAVRKQMRKIEPVTIAVTSKPATSGRNGTAADDEAAAAAREAEAAETARRRQKRFQTYKKDLQAVKSVAVIVLVFMICWLPLSISNSISALFPHVVQPPNYVPVSIVLSHANSAINPFLYAYGKEFRMGYRRTFAKMFPCICAMNPNNSVRNTKANANAVSTVEGMRFSTNDTS